MFEMVRQREDQMSDFYSVYGRSFGFCLGSASIPLKSDAKFHRNFYAAMQHAQITGQ
jgi:hypothetical protein